MKRFAILFLLAVVWSTCGVGQVVAADSLAVIFTANTFGAFAPCPT
ncbi:hypothetical protein G3N56_01230 [Desulfovibrio sulfodismutans]|uniref:Uncharacterized protein n=1 Tax=Desulfolutivibrio sulfodismutans TaxID=63561 RepID=A0A7K3NGP4_9BACT|nr:hypothetical protein [Desulfolutivibrio sulfodismutans]NDY55366.1 hypothetical protein [Desulfolutivibrio sulfodismutans]